MGNGKVKAHFSVLFFQLLGRFEKFEIKLEEKSKAIFVGNKTYYLMEFQIQEKYPDMNKSKIKVILDQN